MTASRDPNYSALAIPLEPGAAALIRLGVELVMEAYERDPETTLTRLAEVAARGDEPFEVAPELLVTDNARRLSHFPFGPRGSTVSGRHISSPEPASDVAAIRESPLNVTRHPRDFQFADRWPSSRTQSSRPPNRVTTFHTSSSAPGASGLLQSTHAHSPDAADANMSTASSVTSIVTLKPLRFITGTGAAKGLDPSSAHADSSCRRESSPSFVLLPLSILMPVEDADSRD